MKSILGLLPHLAGIVSAIYGGVMAWAKLFELWANYRLIVLDCVMAVEERGTVGGDAKKAEAVQMVQQKIDALIPAKFAWATGVVNTVISVGLGSAIDGLVAWLNSTGFLARSNTSSAAG